MIYRFAQFEVDEGEFHLSTQSRVLALEPKALRVLLYLLQNPNRLVRKQDTEKASRCASFPVTVVPEDSVIVAIDGVPTG